MNQCEYNYQSGELGIVSLNLKSSIDDSWVGPPVNTIIDDAYSQNSLLIHKLNLVEKLETNDVILYL